MRHPRKLLLIGLVSILLLNRIPLYANAQAFDLQMEVGQRGQKSASFPVGQQHRWFIRTEIPDRWEETDSFSVFQTLSPALTLDAASIGLKLVRKDGEQILLRMEEHYQIAAGSVFVEEGIADRFCVSLTPDGMAFLSEYQDLKSELLITYAATINSTAPMGEQIVGSAQVNLTNAEGKRTALLSNKAVVAAGGIHIRLSGPSGEPLSNGRFMLAREANQKELEDPAVMKELLDTGEETIAVIYERFFATEDMSGEKTDIAVTDESGHAVCYGLAYGTYYLVQMESVSADMLASEPVQVTVSGVSHITARDGWRNSMGNLVDNSIQVSNSMLAMPKTGGVGTVPYRATGAVVIFCACMLLWYNKKKTLSV